MPPTNSSRYPLRSRGRLKPLYPRTCKCPDVQLMLQMPLTADTQLSFCWSGWKPPVAYQGRFLAVQMIVHVTMHVASRKLSEGSGLCTGSVCGGRGGSSAVARGRQRCIGGGRAAAGCRGASFRGSPGLRRVATTATVRLHGGRGGRVGRNRSVCLLIGGQCSAALSTQRQCCSSQSRMAAAPVNNNNGQTWL